MAPASSLIDHRGVIERAAVYEGTVDAGPRRDGGWQVRTRLAYTPDRETA
jgi:hypothetical protein